MTGAPTGINTTRPRHDGFGARSAFAHLHAPQTYVVPIIPPAPRFDPRAVGAVVFDLGNVLIELDNARYNGGWPNDIGADHEDFEAWIAGERLWYAYETGAVSTPEFIARLTKRLGLSPKQVTDYWNALLVGLLPGVAEVLEVLRERYPLYILSNTNETHIEWVRRYMTAIGYGDYETRWFAHPFYSYEMGTVKPESAIYRQAQARIGLPAERLLFIDDRAENVVAARAEGWQSVEFGIGESLGEVLRTLMD